MSLDDKARTGVGLAADARRFIVAGAANTALTAAIYFAGLVFFSPTASYAIAWIAGLAFVMLFYPDRVFVGGARSINARLSLGAATVGVFLIGVLVLRRLVDMTGDARLAFLFTLVLTTALNLIAGRMLLRRGH